VVLALPALLSVVVSIPALRCWLLPLLILRLRLLVRPRLLVRLRLVVRLRLLILVPPVA